MFLLAKPSGGRRTWDALPLFIALADGSRLAGCLCFLQRAEGLALPIVILCKHGSLLLLLLMVIVDPILSFSLVLSTGYQLDRPKILLPEVWTHLQVWVPTPVPTR